MSGGREVGVGRRPGSSRLWWETISIMDTKHLVANLNMRFENELPHVTFLIQAMDDLVNLNTGDSNLDVERANCSNRHALTLSRLRYLTYKQSDISLKTQSYMANSYDPKY